MENTRKPQKRRRGRPTRAETIARALREIGVDPISIDPRRILASIAADESAPASARVAAARALLSAQNPTPTGDNAELAADRAALDRRALEILNRKRVN
jgi:hypothetical protein